MTRGGRDPGLHHPLSEGRWDLGRRASTGINVFAVITEAGIWRSAIAMTRRYSHDATVEAAMRADRLLADGA